MNSKRTQELFKGIGVIIDNNINNANSTDRILKIKRYLENKHFPILTYESLPSDEEIQCLHSVSFIILDWNLSGNDIGVAIPEETINDNIDFLNRLKKISYAPDFIFTNEDTDSIINILKDNELYHDEFNHIFVKNKESIKSGKSLFSCINQWLNKTPSVYVMKEWENKINTAKTQLYYDLYGISPFWPITMYKTYKNDFGTETNSGIVDLINRNLTARCSSIELDSTILNKRKTTVKKEGLRKLLEYDRFIKGLPDYPCMGDVFKEQDGEDYIYYINIRPDCDIIRDDNPQLYLIKGTILDETQINKEDSEYRFDKGSFIEKVTHSILSFIDDGKIVEFKFRNFKVINWKKMKGKRIGRLLPPYVTRIKNQYVAFLNRQGIPSIPDNSI